METRARMAMNANRRIVSEGLSRRKMEKQLDAFEDQMIRRCNERCDAANFDRKMENTLQLEEDLRKARILAREQKRAAAARIRKDTALGILSFFAASVIFLWLTTWTYLPVWAAATLILGSLFLLETFICKLHGLLKVEVTE